MFYATKEGGHGLAEDPIKGCIAPRPIAWISTLSAAGVVNLAPYSFFNSVAAGPPMVMFASGGREPRRFKDTITNCKETGEFVVNVATWALRLEMVQTSASVPPEVDEMALAGLEVAPSHLVKPPRVAASPINLECTVYQVLDLPCHNPNGSNAMVVGEIVGVHIAESVLTEGYVDPAKLQPLGRLGRDDYVHVTQVFDLPRPA